ncbi:MAG: hypothetical protein KBC94_27950 [Pseudacidovorax sp.]|uniref:hypothetical protein n=1 Tax=Pseudacidovorax sp. TaxID=1934311 RepID=UPI001B69E9BD|nr:hypothetical protein [Pseudacidovorax sp.]MBP6898270.1 hypothetical protein [Pseudacidovorax sp.]
MNYAQSLEGNRKKSKYKYLRENFSRIACALVTVYICTAKAEILGATIDGKRLKIQTDTAETAISVNTRGTIIGYKVNCSKTKLVAWGVPDELNFNAPQIGFVTIVDSKNPLGAKRKILAQGVMDIEFLKNKKYAFIASNSGEVINLENGKLEYVPEDRNLERFPREECRKARWQTFEKY